jgi:hypothetical protein
MLPWFAKGAVFNMACKNSANSMGFQFGLDSKFVPKQKFRWLFQISGISALDTGISKALPPRRSARPTLGWKEQEVNHLTETVYFPLKPTWEPVDLVLYDICRNGNQCNPVFVWIATSQANQQSGGFYDPQVGKMIPIVDAKLKRQGDIYVYDGCGNELEHWVLENCYPHQVRWGELDMDSSDLLTVEVSLRYDRAYMVCNGNANQPPGGPGSGRVGPPTAPPSGSIGSPGSSPGSGSPGSPSGSLPGVPNPIPRS